MSKTPETGRDAFVAMAAASEEHEELKPFVGTTSPGTSGPCAAR